MRQPSLDILYGFTFSIIFGTLTAYCLLFNRHVRTIWASTQGSREITDEAVPIESFVAPPEFADFDQVLRDFGYMPFGIMRRNYVRLKQQRMFHLYRTPDGATIARLNEGEPQFARVSIVTWFEDNSVIVTEYPRGLTVERKRITSRYSRTSLTSAEKFHTERVAKWIALGRRPKVISDMETYIGQQLYFREHYDSLFGNPWRIHALKLAFLTGFIILALISLMVAFSTFDLNWVLLAAILTAGLMFWRNVTLQSLGKWWNNPPGALEDTDDSLDVD